MVVCTCGVAPRPAVWGSVRNGTDAHNQHVQDLIKHCCEAAKEALAYVETGVRN
jgi:hypothetical protein